MKPFTTLAAILFLVIAILHAIRIVFGWAVVINGSLIPYWVSWVALAVALLLAAMLWREARS